MVALFHTVKPLWMAWAPARPPLSKPIPESRVLASMIFFHSRRACTGFQSQLRLHTLFHQGIKTQLCQSVGRQCSMSSRTGEGILYNTARASKYVASASPIPETVSLTGDCAITSVSMRTISGLEGRNRYSSKRLFRINNRKSTAGRVRRCDGRADHHGSMPVISHCLAVSRILPPPIPITRSQPSFSITPDQTVDFRLAAFSVKIIKYSTASGFRKARLHTAADSL